MKMMANLLLFSVTIQLETGADGVDVVITMTQNDSPNMHLTFLLPVLNCVTLKGLDNGPFSISISYKLVQ